MSWAKFDDRFPSHLKILRLSDVAFRLYVTSICFCCEQLTDGLIEDGIPETLPRSPRGKRLTDAVQELVTAGLWENQPGGWLVHDFLDWNPNAETVLTKRAAAKERMKDARSKRVRANVRQNEQPNESRSSPNPVPVPVPVGSPPTPPGGTKGGDIQTKARDWLALAARANGAGRGEADMRFGDPSKWPEVIALCRDAMREAFGREDMPRQSRDDRARLILERFADGYSPEQLREALLGAAKSDHLGNRRDLQGITVVFKDGARVDRYRSLYVPPEQPKRSGPSMMTTFAAAMAANPEDDDNAA